MSERKISSDCNQIEICLNQALLSTYNPIHKLWKNSYRFGAPRPYHQFYSVKNRTSSSMSEHEFISQPKNVLPHLISHGLTRFFYYPHLFFKKSSIRSTLLYNSLTVKTCEWIQLNKDLAYRCPTDYVSRHSVCQPALTFLRKSFWRTLIWKFFFIIVLLLRHVKLILMMIAPNAPAHKAEKKRGGGGGFP